MFNRAGRVQAQMTVQDVARGRREQVRTPQFASRHLGGCSPEGWVFLELHVGQSGGQQQDHRDRAGGQDPEGWSNPEARSPWHGDNKDHAKGHHEHHSEIAGTQ